LRYLFFVLAAQFFKRRLECLAKCSLRWRRGRRSRTNGEFGQNQTSKRFVMERLMDLSHRF